MKTSDAVLIRQLEVRCVIGTHPHERNKKQSVFFDLELPADASKPAKNDDLRQALDYERLSVRIREFAGTTRFFLIETLAERTAAMVLKEFGVAQVRLSIWKPGAIKGCANVGVSILRKRSGR